MLIEWSGNLKISNSSCQFQLSIVKCNQHLRREKILYLKHSCFSWPLQWLWDRKMQVNGTKLPNEPWRITFLQDWFQLEFLLVSSLKPDQRKSKMLTFPGSHSPCSWIAKLVLVLRLHLPHIQSVSMYIIMLILSMNFLGPASFQFVITVQQIVMAHCNYARSVNQHLQLC